MSKYNVSIGIMKESNGNVTPILTIKDIDKVKSETFLNEKRVEFTYTNDFYGLRDALCRYLDFINLFNQEQEDLSFLFKKGYYKRSDVEQALEDANFTASNDIELTCDF